MTANRDGGGGEAGLQAANLMHIACASDENYAPHCAAMLHSLLKHNAPVGVAVHFLHGSALDRKVLSGLEQLVHGRGSAIRFHVIPDIRVTGLQKRGEVAGVMWYRIFLPELLPELDRILYLDADTLVMDSLEPLWNTDISDCFAAAVCNDFEPALRYRPQQLGLRSSADYFNSGVLLMNLAKMRRENVTAQILQVARIHGDKLMWQDQDPFNIVFNGNWKRLHPRWNCQNSLFYFNQASDVFGSEAVVEACTQPGVLHFEGPHPLKPWHYLSKHPYRHAYLAHRAATPWKDFQPEGRNLLAILLRPLPTVVTLQVLHFIYRLKRRLSRLLRALPGPRPRT